LGSPQTSLRIPANRITAIIAGKRGITADTALRLARYFGTSAEVWMGLQADYDLQTERDNTVQKSNVRFSFRHKAHVTLDAWFNAATISPNLRKSRSAVIKALIEALHR
jgi:plasmid maintenance system antidote protein VapI